MLLRRSAELKDSTFAISDRSKVERMCVENTVKQRSAGAKRIVVEERRETWGARLDIRATPC